MARSLLDVNVLIALLDASHLHHRAATEWLRREVAQGWASCPITQNGCIRIMSSPGYPNPQAPGKVAQRLADAATDPSHAFWPDAVNLLQGAPLRWERVLGPRQVTDVYLLALAVSQGGRFVTLDRSIALDAVPGARPDQLMVIGAS